MEYKILNIINSEPTFEVPLSKIWEACQKGGAVKILDPAEYITDQQRRWYKGICLPALVKWDENGETLGWWDTEVKRQCNGLALLKKEIFYLDSETGRIGIGRLTTKGVGVKKMKGFITEILSKAVANGWPLSEPDPELRK